jgi:hypothetical protein
MVIALSHAIGAGGVCPNNNVNQKKPKAHRNRCEAAQPDVLRRNTFNHNRRNMDDYRTAELLANDWQFVEMPTPAEQRLPAARSEATRVAIRGRTEFQLAPRLWRKEEQLLFAALPQDIQQIIARRERDRERELRRLQNLVAELKPKPCLPL